MKVLTKMHAGVCTEASREDSHESAHGNPDSAHENVHESVVGQLSHVPF